MRSYMSALKAVEKAGGKTWLVGDTARMIAMNLQPDVLSMVTDSCGPEALADRLGNGTVGAVGGFPVLRAAVLDMPVEVALLQGGSIKENLTRKDFSMNAIAFRSDWGVVELRLHSPICRFPIHLRCRALRPFASKTKRRARHRHRCVFLHGKR